MSTIEALEADQSGEKPFLKTEEDVETLESSLQVSTPPEGEKLPWCVADVVWSKIPGHPWWPSLIAHEPNTAVYFKMKGRTRYYHVQFFGTELMRGWVTERNVLKYEGKSHFLSLRLSVHGKQHKIGKKQLPVWENAIKMADEALPLNHHERQESFNVFMCSIVETPDTVVDQGTGDVPSEFEDKMSNATPGTMNDDHEDISADGGEPPVKKTRVDDADMLTMDGTKPDNAKPKNNSPRKSSKSTVKQTALTTPKQMKTTPNKQVNNKVNKPVNKELAKHVNKKLDQQGKNKLDKPVNNNKLDIKQVANKLDKQVKKIKDNCIFVNHSPTACTVQMSIENGKRKRGRPRKDLLFLVGHSKTERAVTLAKKLKIEKIRPSANTLPNNLSSPSAESEKSDGASDTNSISSLDIESRKSLSKIKEFVCAVCEKPDNLLICEGICNSAYHKDCLTRDVLPDKFICDKCTTGNHTCFVCGKADNVIKCSSQNCGKCYHLDCIKTLDAKIKDENFICPLHHCNVCGTKKSSTLKRRLTCCTRCPVAYHSSTCIVAGSLPITSGYLVCNRHFIADPKKAHHLHVNVNWCFVCSIGGTLICCESCPAAFHAECIEEAGIPEGRFFCRDCKDGKEMLYGEIVWVKLGMYRWWPAQICNPNNIPTNIQRMKHQPGEFPVQFLGSHDYYWIHRGRVFSYQEGDKGSIGSGGKYLAEIFKKALVEAQEKYTEWQKAQEEKAEKDLEKLSKKPAVYKHIKINRYTTATRYVIDECEWSTCDCSFHDENPCGPDAHCLNRILYVECSPLKCPAREKCQNQCFVKRQYLDCEPFRAERRGWGLKAKADAKKGQFVIEYVGELINDETCRERVRKGINDGVINYYMLTIDKDCIIDAGPMGNLSRFMNHCCDPNCETQKWTVNGEVRVGLFAKRDIKEGEELVFDYQLDCLGNEKKKCSCGSENCSGFLGVRPKTQHALKLQEEKKKNQESKKKKKKTANKKNVDEHEDECYDCGDGGELIMCSKTGCSKCYHLSCLTIEKIPHGDWLCPWHFCDDCGKAAMIRCQECSNSFCLAHGPGQITEMADGRYLCDQHPESGLDTSDVSNNTPTITPSDPNVTSKEPGNTTNIPTHPIDEPPSVSTDPTNVPANPTNAPLNLTSVLSNSANAPIIPASDPTNPTNTSTDASSAHTSTSGDPTNTPTNASSVSTSTSNDPTNSTNAPINPTSDPTSPTNASSSLTSTSNGPTNTPTNASSAPTSTSNDPTNSTNAPINPTSDPTNPTSTTTSTYISTDPTKAANAPLNPTSDPTNPTSDVDNATNTPNGPSIVHNDLVKIPASVNEDPPVS